MESTIEFEVYGDYALFSQPELRTGGEKFTFQVPTYEALKGIVQSVYWKPTIVWVVDAVRVMNPIRTECKGIRTIKYQKPVDDRSYTDRSYYTYLRDCRYQVRAHFEWNRNRPERACDRNPKKHLDIARRSVNSGGRRDIFLGTRECQGYVRPCIFGEGTGAYDSLGRLDFGMMYHGITYADEAYSPETKGNMTIRLWRAFMEDGIIRFPRPEECPVQDVVRKMPFKEFDVRDQALVESGVIVP